jgi:cation:H+ antiporter
MIVKLLAAPFVKAAAVAATAISAIWTFPSMLLSAFLIAWGAEAAQFLISQGLALALLAWLQTLPEFAVEAVIAWEAGKNPETAHLAIANLTGAIRLLIGLGWPMIYFVAAWSGRKQRGALPHIELDREHSVEVMGLLPPLLYFVVIWWKQSMGMIDAAILILMYAVYLWILFQAPPHAEEELSEAPKVSQWAYNLGPKFRWAGIIGLFVVGGLLLYFTAHPFLNSMLALATAMGIAPFVFVQWVAPFLSEFPEKVSAFAWARRISKAPMALMNMVSSNINQWTILAAMIPILFSWSHYRAFGNWVPFTFDGEQQVEIGLTVAQSVLAMLLLMNLRFGWLDAASLFVLWLVQFLQPSWREEITLVYLGWCLWQIGLFITKKQELKAPRVFWEVITENRRRRKLPRGTL